MDVIRTDTDVQAYCNLCEQNVDAVVRVAGELLACAACLDEHCRALIPKAHLSSISGRTAGLLAKKAFNLAKAGSIGELQVLTDETDGPGGHILGAWLNVAVEWDNIDQMRADRAVEVVQARYREEALLQLLRECLPAQECYSSLKRLDAWVNKQPLVDENGLGPEGVCLQCATASATDHASDCAFRPDASAARACAIRPSTRAASAAALTATNDPAGTLRAMVLRLADYLETVTGLLEEQEGDDDVEDGAFADDFADARELVAHARALAADGVGQGGGP